jgi:hypothetical protein
LLDRATKVYTNKTIEAVEVIQQLIELAKKSDRRTSVTQLNLCKEETICTTKILQVGTLEHIHLFGLLSSQIGLTSLKLQNREVKDIFSYLDLFFLKLVL